MMLGSIKDECELLGDDGLFTLSKPYREVSLCSSFKFENADIETLVLSMLRFNSKLVLGGSFGIELFQIPLSKRINGRDVDFQISEELTNEEIVMLVDMFQLKKVERFTYTDEEEVSDILSFKHDNIKVDIFIESCVKKHDIFNFSYYDAECNKWELRVGHPKYAYSAKTKYVLSSAGYNDKHYKDIMSVMSPPRVTVFLSYINNIQYAIHCSKYNMEKPNVVELSTIIPEEYKKDYTTTQQPQSQSYFEKLLNNLPQWLK